MDKRGRISIYKPSIKQSVRWHFKYFKVYCYTSIIGAILMFSLLYIFTDVFKIYYIISFTIVYIIVTTNAFLLDRFFVFRLFNPKRMHKQYYRFFIISIVAYIINLTFLYILVHFFDIWYLLAQLIISVVGLPLLYLSHRNMVFSYI